MQSKSARKPLSRLSLMGRWSIIAPLVLIGILCQSISPRAISTRAYAADSATPTPTPKPTPFPNSLNNYQGDRVTFPVNMTVCVDKGNGKLELHTLKKGIELRGIGQLSPTTANFVVTHCNRWLPFLNNFKCFREDEKQKCSVLDDDEVPPPTASPGDACQNAPEGSSKTDLIRGSTVQLDLANLAQHEPNRYGLAYGGLVVPFKFQLTGAHQLTSSATAGPYVGFKADSENWGLGWTLALFAGPSNIAVTNTKTSSSSSSNSTEQVAGFGWGGGLLLDVKGGFQGGAVIGWDYVGNLGSNQSFQYNDKPWLALQLGYSFSQ